MEHSSILILLTSSLMELRCFKYGTSALATMRSTMPPEGQRDFLLTLYWQKYSSFSRSSEAVTSNIKIMGNEANGILT